MATKGTIVQQAPDRFVNLVSGGRKMGGYDILPEIPPINYKHKTLERAEAKPIEFPKFDYEKSYQDFLKELKGLREYYKPYLKNYAHAPESKRTEIELSEFDFRRETEQDKLDFSLVLDGKGEWEKVKIPHYVGPVGIYYLFYRTKFNIDKKEDSKSYVLDFSAVDYIGEIYLNGRLVKRHEGFFAPFLADISPYVREGENTLVVAVQNLYIATGADTGLDRFAGRLYGNKVYGETHIGYDDPDDGWHHCPSGAGIIAKVKLVIANTVRINDVWVRPDCDNSCITVNTIVYNYAQGAPKFRLHYTVEGRNFEELVVDDVEGKENTWFFNAENYCSETLSIPNFKWWNPTDPNLYQVTVSLVDEQGNVVDTVQTHFGMRKFIADENTTPKGKFYLNNERIILRGANEMGHLPRCVMAENFDQLIDDILIAKICGMNYYRLTQRPVFKEVYDYMDMLGMMCQTDFPMFGNTRYNLIGEDLKQTAEMEILTRNHPCCVVESFCNETLDTICWHSEQYRVERHDLEKLFDAMRKVVQIHNPDRVVKYNDGDFSTLKDSWGITDFHTYTLWYLTHEIAYGKLERGWLPGMRTDWMVGCGEYGTDGLDCYAVMEKYYPKDWLPDNLDDYWDPSVIAKGQCWRIHGPFFPQQFKILDWIRESQEWQRKAVKMYQHALRRRCDLIQSTAIHLLIDAWPAGWTKTLVGVDRIPKPAYYAFKEANIPVRISLRRDKYTLYVGESINTEIFALNDTPKDTDTQIQATVYFNDKVYSTYSYDFKAKAVYPNYTGEIIETFDKPGKVKVVAKMVANGIETFDETEYVIKPKMVKATKTPLILSDKLACIKDLCDGEVDENIIFVDGEYYTAHKEYIDKKIENGARVCLFIEKPLKVIETQIDFRVHIRPDELGAGDYAFVNTENRFAEGIEKDEFRNFYNKKLDYMDLIQYARILGFPDSKDILYTVGEVDPDNAPYKKHNPVACNRKYGKGEIIVTTLRALDGFVGINPMLDKFYINLIEVK